MQTQKNVTPVIVPQNLDLNVHGSFPVKHAHDLRFRCGPHGSPRTIKYNLVISSHPSLLDERGFIVDWRDVQEAIFKRFRYARNFPSCENIAQVICALVVALLGDRCTGVRTEVTIDGLPASMVAQYSKQ